AADPDVGPKRIHPTAGATAIGARPFLVAFNIYLDTTDVTIAKDIAKRIRASGGGLPAVQASGFEVEGKAQVSMNLLDIDTTSPAAGVPPRWRGRSPPRSSPWWRGSRSGGRLMPACSSASRRFWPKPTPCAPSSAVSRTTMPPRTRRSARPTGSRKAIPGGPVRRTKRSSGRPRRRSRWPAVVENGHGMLEVGGQRPVFGHHRPLVVQGADVRAADVHHRLDGECHSGHEPGAAFRLAVVRHLRVLMEGRADPVPDQLP